MTGQAVFKHIIPDEMYENIKLHSRKLGHLSAVYCVLFDRTGSAIFTVKIPLAATFTKNCIARKSRIICKMLGLIWL